MPPSKAKVAVKKSKTTAKLPVAKKAPAKSKAPAQKKAAPKPVAKKAAPKPAPAKKAVAKKVVAKKAVAKKAVAKKVAPAVAKKVVAKKATPAVAKKAAPKVAVAKKAAPKPAVVKKAAPTPAVAKKAPVAAKSSAKKTKSTPARDARQAWTQKQAIAAALSPEPIVEGKEVVDAYMRDVDHPFKAEMEAVRSIILGVSPKITERIKWNAPSFFYKEDLGAFHPRATEYAHLILLFPGGEGMKDSSGLLEGNHKDRREAKFYSLGDGKTKKKALETIVKGWLALRD